jgi:hypothetical protein
MAEVAAVAEGGELGEDGGEGGRAVKIAMGKVEAEIVKRNTMVMVMVVLGVFPPRGLRKLMMGWRRARVRRMSMGFMGGSGCKYVFWNHINVQSCFRGWRVKQLIGFVLTIPVAVQLCA